MLQRGKLGALRIFDLLTDGLLGFRISTCPCCSASGQSPSGLGHKEGSAGDGEGADALSGCCSKALCVSICALCQVENAVEIEARADKLFAVNGTDYE